MDLWYGFACHGLDLLRQDGVLCFIAQNNWTTSSGAKLMRKKVIEDSKILQMLDFNTYMIFENADIQTMVMLFQRNESSDNYNFDYRSLLENSEKEDMLSLLEKRNTQKTKYLSPKLLR
jgi:adenine-specific DNA-methyltransferase